MNTLKERISSYEEAYNFKFTNKLPIVFIINGRSFAKNTQLLTKPYSLEFAECMQSTMSKLVQEIDGSVLGYTFNDEIVIISKNDQNPDTMPWYDNRLQKMCSISASAATLHFNNLANAMDLRLINDSFFTSNVFIVPNNIELINLLIYKQQQNFYLSIYNSCFYELLKKYNKFHIKEMLSNTTVDEKIEILLQECNINFNAYPSAFKRGVACYRSPHVINDEIRYKWLIDEDLPIFTKDHLFLDNVFKFGYDLIKK